MDVVADAVDCESRGASVRGGCARDRGLGVARGGFRDQVGRLTDREEEGKVVLQLDGCFLSTGIVGALTYRPERGKRKGGRVEGYEAQLCTTIDRGYVRCSGNESRSYPHPFVPSYVHLHRTRSTRTVNARHYLPAKTRIRTYDNVSFKRGEEFAIDVAVFALEEN